MGTLIRSMVIYLLLFTAFSFAQQAVVSYTLINAATDLEIGPLEEGSVVNLAVVGTSLNINANTSPAVVGSVYLQYWENGSNIKNQTENVGPYALYGNNGSDYNSYTPAVGNHTLTSTPYTGATRGGTAGTPLTIHFTVINQAGPTANAGTDQTVYLPATLATLNGTASTPTVAPMDTWAWTQRSGPNTAVLVNANQAVCTANGLIVGTYVFRLTVTDQGSSSWDEMTVMVNPGNPTADAGADQAVILPVNSAALNGSNSSDVPPGTIISYYWSQSSGPSTATLTGFQNAQCTVSNLIAGVYTFVLDVEDNDGYVDSDEVMVTVLTEGGGGGIISGELKKWHKITVTWDGAQTFSETGTPNPFRDYRLNVTFSGPSSQQYVVPGYFAADGNAAETSAASGNKWRVHFTPDATGQWSFSVSFRTGTDIAVSDVANAGTAVAPINGTAGSFSVAANDKVAPDLRAKGRLQYVNKHHLRFAETGAYFMKMGADSPENFLAYEDFDNTTNNGGRRKSWSPHAGDWQAGDPSWQGGKGTEIIGAVNYLASEGMNVFSFMPMSINGDDDNSFPYTTHNGAASPQTARTQFDCSKLDQWGIVFDHAMSKGMYLHFKTSETENELLLDNGAVGLERKLYYRELIARFGYHLALNWNLGEENNDQSDQQRKDMAQYFYDHDPYHHLVVIHTFPGSKNQIYTPLLGNNSKLTGASLQSGWNAVHDDTKTWVANSANAGKKWVVANDEQGGANLGVPDDAYTGTPTQDDIREQTVWGNIMAGGAGCEFYFGYSRPHSDLSCQDFRSRDQFWNYALYAMKFFESYIPFWEMVSADNLVTSGQSNYGFSGIVGVNRYYVIYLRDGDGNKDVIVDLPTGDYFVKWYDPRNGGALQDGTQTQVHAASPTNIGHPLVNRNLDWVALLTSEDPIAVHLGNFEALPRDGAVLLRWSSDNETNHAGYNLYRSAATGEFEKINESLITHVEDGHPLQPRSYEYLDYPEQTGTIYYRLEDIALDGGSTFHGPISVQFTTKVDEKSASPAHFELAQNHPNPFNPQTFIRFELPAEERASLTIYDVLGNVVRRLTAQTYPAGSHTVMWDGLDDNGSSVSTGVYLYQLQAGAFLEIRKMILMR